MTKNVNLSEICTEKKYCVIGFEIESSEYAQKLNKMGFVAGTPIGLAPIKIADPMVFQIRGSRIALRKKEAKQVRVKEL